MIYIIMKSAILPIVSYCPISSFWCCHFYIFTYSESNFHLRLQLLKEYFHIIATLAKQPDHPLCSLTHRASRKSRID